MTLKKAYSLVANGWEGWNSRRRGGWKISQILIGRGGGGAGIVGGGEGGGLENFPNINVGGGGGGDFPKI